MARNITEVRLLNVPLESDYKHTLYFGSKSAQTEYFKGKTVKYGTDFTYQRKEKRLRFPADYDELIGCNYLMYKNSSYSSKWFYAFITKIEYVNDGVSFVYFETDVIQTWMFDYTVRPSFIEREHVMDDTAGLHTVPEQLETGDYVINDKNNNESLQFHGLVIGSTIELNDDNDDYKNAQNVAGGYYNGIYSGVKYYEITDAESMNTILTKLANGAKSDAVTSIFTTPNLFVKATTPSGKKYAEVTKGQSAVRKDWRNQCVIGQDENGNDVLEWIDRENYKPTHINGHTPRNNKLFTYPYTYMLMTNNSGGSAVYKYELFNNPDDPNHCAFYIYGTITPGMSIRISPRYYNGVAINSIEGLNLGKFPICSWATDVYTNWLTQNSVNIATNLLTGVGQIAGGVALAGGTGGLGALVGGGSIANGVGTIANTLTEVYTHSLQPPQAEGNLNSGDVSFTCKTLTFTAYQMCIKKEFAEIIDGYFDMFGYKVNEVKVPNKNHRKHWWFTKTIDANIDGAVPMEDMAKIKACYDNGITFWKNPANIGNYSLINEII